MSPETNDSLDDLFGDPKLDSEDPLFDIFGGLDGNEGLDANDDVFWGLDHADATQPRSSETKQNESQKETPQNIGPETLGSGAGCKRPFVEDQGEGNVAHKSMRTLATTKSTDHQKDPPLDDSDLFGPEPVGTDEIVCFNQVPLETPDGGSSKEAPDRSPLMKTPDWGSPMRTPDFDLETRPPIRGPSVKTPEPESPMETPNFISPMETPNFISPTETPDFGSPAAEDGDSDDGHLPTAIPPLYWPLNASRRQIRLLYRIQDAPMWRTYRMLTYDFDQAPPFTALSYTWGEPTPMYTIIVNGCETSIRQNLFRYLGTSMSSSVAKPTNPETSSKHHINNLSWFYIDQICIDQNSIEERGQQVQLMGDIFRKAKDVVVWLGRPKGRLSSLRHIFDLINEQKTKGIPMQTLRVDIDAEGFCQNAYWNRLWIIQELVLSQRISFRDSTSTIALSWPDFLQTIVQHERCSKTVGYIAAHSRAAGGSGQLDPIATVDMFADHICQELVDKYYALQGLFHHTAVMQVDYSRFIKDVFDDAVALLAQSTPLPPLIQSADYKALVMAIVRLGIAMGAIWNGGSDPLQGPLLSFLREFERTNISIISRPFAIAKFVESVSNIEL